MKRCFSLIIVSIILCLILFSLTVMAGEQARITLQLVATGNIHSEYEKVIARFAEKYSKIVVDLRTFSSGDAYNQALLGQVASGLAPDVFLLDGGNQISKFARLDAVLPLEDLADKAGLDLANFQDSLLQAFVVDGKLYGIPKDYNTTALYYHKDLLEKAGMEPPTTWEELRKAAKRLTIDEHYGFGMLPQINYYLPFITSAGAKFVTPDGIDTANFVTAEHVKALELLLTLFKEDKSTVSPQMVGAGWDGAMFAEKKVVMVYGGSWIGNVVLGMNPDLEIGAAPLPAEDRAGMLYTAGWVVSGDSKYPEAALKFIKFMSSDDELVALHQSGILGLLPTKTGVKKLINAQEDNQLIKVYDQIASNGIPFGWLQPEFVDKYNKMIDKLLTSDQDIKTALMELNSEIKKMK
jgi:multiple sugar transport system substrate-binding protein